ncbi:salivary glue protein [Bifidobacterium dentium]|uniref:Uncharacterized protein n=1 Tax=Bifidobacterium dentium ATCC 27679 TaxID=871562 RepID=E0QA69_9BIFI|nr:hypothetical protein HMPREF0168_2027 [Bifidobacterium dentium ATCC 27679]NEG40495.1 salivary glue protein [Bifidobacterium dentium]TFZ22786.1 salivary glue protein [Bifidobacterium dentium]
MRPSTPGVSRDTYLQNVSFFCRKHPPSTTVHHTLYHPMHPWQDGVPIDVNAIDPCQSTRYKRNAGSRNP